MTRERAAVAIVAAYGVFLAVVGFTTLFGGLSWR